MRRSIGVAFAVFVLSAIAITGVMAGAPNPNLNGALNKIDAANQRVTSVSGFITSIYEEVMGTEPSPFGPDIVPALEAVQVPAKDIADAIDGYVPPAGVPDDFIIAFGYVAGSALDVVKNAQSYIRQISAGGVETGLSLIYGDPDVLTELHCYGLHPWSDAGERHGGIDLKPPYRDLVGTSVMRKEEVSAPASGIVDWIVKGTTGAGAESWVVVLKINTYWYAVLVFEPQSLDSEILLEQDRSIDVQEGQQVNRGERIGDLVVGKVIENRYPHIHFSFLYKNPEESMEDLFDDPDSILRSDGTDLAPTTGAGSPWAPQDLGISSTFFCPYIYSTSEAQQAMDSVDRYNVNGEPCSCVCAYNSENGDCGDCQKSIPSIPLLLLDD